VALCLLGCSASPLARLTYKLGWRVRPPHCLCAPECNFHDLTLPFSSQNNARLFKSNIFRFPPRARRLNLAPPVNRFALLKWQKGFRNFNTLRKDREIDRSELNAGKVLSALLL